MAGIIHGRAISRLTQTENQKSDYSCHDLQTYTYSQDASFPIRLVEKVYHK